MTKPLPTECIGTRRTWDGEPAIIDCEVTVPECYYPPLPFKPHRGKHKNALMFPTGTFRGVFCSNELEHAVNSGARVERVFHSQVYRLEPWLEEYVRPTYERRKLAKIERDAALKRGDSSDVQRWEFELYAQKILLNAVYGKLIEDSEHENWTGDMAATEDVPEEYLREFHVRTNRGPIIPIWGIKSFSPGAFQHYASGAWIPAGGRVALHIGLVETDAAYCDTDSLVTLPGRNPSNVDASELGAWKHEGYYEFGGEFLAPKVYALDSGDSFQLRAKGFFRPEGVSKRAFWDHIKRGGIIGIEKTSSWIDQINAGLLAPSREALYRVFQGGAPKRFFYPDGNSRPWSVVEILEH